MKDTIKEAEEILKTGIVAPGVAVELRTKLIGEYSFYASQLGDILSRKPKVWLSLRDTVTSDAQADRKYELSADGVDEIGIKLKLKVIEKMISGLKSVVDLANNERNNSH